jgi:hypothetical protein
MDTTFSSDGNDPDARPTAGTAPAVVLRRLSGPLSALLACGIAQEVQPELIELVLNEREASDGGMITISMRVPVHCPRCGGHASEPCAACDSTGTIDELFSAWLAVRPGVLDGTILHPSALLPGMVHPVSFRVRLHGGL